MPSARQVIYVDTNVVLEAQRTGCLSDIMERFDVRTVEMVQIEIQTGDRRREGYVTVNMQEFSAAQSIYNGINPRPLRSFRIANQLHALEFESRNDARNFSLLKPLPFPAAEIAPWFRVLLMTHQPRAETAPKIS